MSERNLSVEKNARQLVLPGETYTIEEYGARCPQCMKLRKHMPAPDTSSEVREWYCSIEAAGLRELLRLAP
jgi:hypothetical protein